MSGGDPNEVTEVSVWVPSRHKSIGECRDCGRQQNVATGRWTARRPPRCSSCGGMLDHVACCYVRVGMKQRLNDAMLEIYREATGKKRKDFSTREQRRARMARETQVRAEEQRCWAQYERDRNAYERFLAGQQDWWRSLRAWKPDYVPIRDRLKKVKVTTMAEKMKQLRAERCRNQSKPN